MKRVCIYGAGQMGLAVKDFLLKREIELDCFIDRNMKLTGTRIEGVPVYHPEKMPQVYREQDDIVIAMSAAPFMDVRDELTNLGYRYVWIAGDFIQNLFPEKCFANIWNISEEDVKEIYKYNEMWSDAESVQCYEAAIEWFNKRTEDKLHGYEMKRDKYYPAIVLKALKDGDTMLDMAIMDGKFVRQFTESIRLGKALAFTLCPGCSVDEPYVESSPDIQLFNCELGARTETHKTMRLGLMRPFTIFEDTEVHTVSAKDFLIRKPFQYMRAYTMSQLYSVIFNMTETLQENRPIIAANIGHYKKDFMCLPQYLKRQLENYSFFFRIHSFQGNDCILYAIPNERMNS